MEKSNSIKIIISDESGEVFSIHVGETKEEIQSLLHALKPQTYEYPFDLDAVQNEAEQEWIDNQDMGSSVVDDIICKCTHWVEGFVPKRK